MVKHSCKTCAIVDLILLNLVVSITLRNLTKDFKNNNLIGDEAVTYRAQIKSLKDFLATLQWW